jgi:hypothetical protein
MIQRTMERRKHYRTGRVPFTENKLVWKEATAAMTALVYFYT